MVVQSGERTASISDLTSRGGALTFLVLRSTQAPELVRLAAGRPSGLRNVLKIRQRLASTLIPTTCSLSMTDCPRNSS